MQEKLNSKLDSSKFNTENFFSTIGKYVIIFQHIETILDQILLLSWGSGNWKESQNKLSSMDIYKKINAVKKIVYATDLFNTVKSTPEINHAFKILIDKLHKERERRNVLLHSYYMFDFLEIGAPVLRSHREHTPGGYNLNQQYITPNYQDELLHEIIALAFETGVMHKQLIHAYGDNDSKK